VSFIPSGSNSMKDTKIITPAEKPKDTERKVGLGFLKKIAIMQPNVVDNPANKETRRAIKKMFIFGGVSLLKVLII